jgi:hypothetical protein
MFVKLGTVQVFGPGLIILLMALLLIGTVYRKARDARRRADLGSDVFRARLNRKPRS